MISTLISSMFKSPTSSKYSNGSGRKQDSIGYTIPQDPFIFVVWQNQGSNRIQVWPLCPIGPEFWIRTSELDRTQIVILWHVSSILLGAFFDCSWLCRKWTKMSISLTASSFYLWTSSLKKKMRWVFPSNITLFVVWFCGMQLTQYESQELRYIPVNLQLNLYN